MDMEYQLDMFTYQFSYFDDYEWTTKKNAFRTFLGSINTINFAVQSQLKNSIELASSHTIAINAIQVQTLRAERNLLSLEYFYKVNDRHEVGINHLLGRVKSDLDATFFYRYASSLHGQIEFSYTALDWANNIVSDINDSRQSNFSMIQNYNKRPHLFSMHIRSPDLGIFRGEIVVGWQPASQSIVEDKDDQTAPFVNQMEANYQGALLEAVFMQHSVGIIYQRRYTKFDRFAASGSSYPLDYGNRQVQHRGAAFLNMTFGRFNIEQWIWLEKNADYQRDNFVDEYVSQDPIFTEMGRNANRYPFTFDEHRIFNKTKVSFSPRNTFLKFSIGYNGDWRNPEKQNGATVAALNYRNYYPNQILERNERLTFIIDLKSTRKINLSIGASIDLDGDLFHGYGDKRKDVSYALFDGGFTRLFVYW